MKQAHSINENWVWLVRGAEQHTEIVGVRYPNGDEVMATDMPAQQWSAYLRAGGLKLTPRYGRGRS